MKYMKQAWIFVGVTAVFLFLTGCINRFNVGPTETISKSVELGGAETAQATIKMGVGELSIQGGAANLMDANFTSNIADWQPEVTYDVDGSKGQLIVQQPEGVSTINGLPDGDMNYEWDIRFTNDVPLNLEVDLGAGQSDLILGGIWLTNLDLSVGVGKTVLDLTGDWRESADITVQGGVGETTVKLPNNIGVRVVTSTGLGSVNVYGLVRNGDVYTNALYDQSEVQLDLNVTGGIGSIRLEAEE